MSTASVARFARPGAVFCIAMALASGCHVGPDAKTSTAQHGRVAPGTPPDVDIARARARGGERRFEWLPFAPESFALAARENKLILIDGAAAWCHWCHVMDETTYVDPQVGAILAEKFVAIRADIDAHPDVAERYGEWGWPATIILSPDAREIGKFRGYLPPAELLGALRDASTPLADATATSASTPPAPEALPWVFSRTVHDLDGFYDPDEGGWGFRQKAPIGDNVVFETLRLARGDASARSRIERSLAGHARLVDPVWGGIYQYSTGGSWNEPHFEKLMTFQAENLEGFARGFAAVRAPAMRAAAESIARYLDERMSSPEGAFYTTQDADVNAHDPSAPFVDGHVFYAKNDAGRRAIGAPRIDKSVYAYENGLAARALVALHEATGEARHLERAKKALDRIVVTHVRADGSVVHDAESKREVRHLADAAALGFALVRLAEVDPASREASLAVARRIAAAMVRDLDDGTGPLFGHTEDPDAVGVFRARRRPFDANVLAARFFAALGRASGDAELRARALRIARDVATPEALGAQGRMLGGYLTLLVEVGAV